MQLFPRAASTRTKRYGIGALHVPLHCGDGISRPRTAHSHGEQQGVGAAVSCCQTLVSSRCFLANTEPQGPGIPKDLWCKHSSQALQRLRVQWHKSLRFTQPEQLGMCADISICCMHTLLGQALWVLKAEVSPRCPRWIHHRVAMADVCRALPAPCSSWELPLGWAGCWALTSGELPSYC